MNDWLEHFNALTRPYIWKAARRSCHQAFAIISSTKLKVSVTWMCFRQMEQLGAYSQVHPCCHTRRLRTTTASSCVGCVATTFLLGLALFHFCCHIHVLGSFLFCFVQFGSVRFIVIMSVFVFSSKCLCSEIPVIPRARAVATHGDDASATMEVMSHLTDELLSARSVVWSLVESCLFPRFHHHLLQTTEAQAWSVGAKN